MAEIMAMASATRPDGRDAKAADGRHGSLDPVLMMLAVIAVAVGLTWVVPSGSFDRVGRDVVPGTYHVIPKAASLDALLAGAHSTDKLASPAGISAVITAQPAGMKQSAGLIVMILLLGGMFGVLRASGSLDAAIDRLVTRTGGRIVVLVPVLMVALSAGSAFLGLISEYLLVIPVTLALATRLGRPPLFGLAIVAVAAKVGYLASVANPVALVIAQPIVGVPVFSGWALRLALWIVALVIGIVAVVRLGRLDGAGRAVVPDSGAPLRPRQLAVVVALGLAVPAVVVGSTLYDWKDESFGAFYIALAVLVAALSGLRPREATHAFIDGMKGMVLAAVLVGMAAAVEIVLRDGRVLDTIIAALAASVGDKPRAVVAAALMGIEMVLTVLIPSTSAKAALSMPILAPIAALNGVTGQTTVLAFLLGNGLVNMLSPTSGMLLAYLATGRVAFGAWARFVLPLWGILMLLCFAVVGLAAVLGYA